MRGNDANTNQDTNRWRLHQHTDKDTYQYGYTCYTNTYREYQHTDCCSSSNWHTDPTRAHRNGYKDQLVGEHSNSNWGRRFG